MKKITILGATSLLWLFLSVSFSWACQRPTNFMITAFTPTTVSFSWDPVIAASNYQLEYRNIMNDTWTLLVFDSNMGTINGLLPSNTYVARLRSDCGSIGLSPYTPNMQFVMPSGPQPCEMPLYIMLDEVTNTSAKFSWTSVSGIVNYQMQYRQIGTADWLSKFVPVNSGTLLDLMPNVLYEARVRANCGDMQSPYIDNVWSNTISFGPLQGNTCMWPMNIMASNITSTGATVKFEKASNVDEVQFQWRKKGESGFMDMFTTITTLTLTGLAPGTTYEHRMRSRCFNNWSDYSPLAELTTMPASGCGTPANITFTDINATNAMITWSAIANATSYQLQYRVKGNAQWFSNTLQTNSRMITNLLPVTNYEVRVRALCSNGTSTYTPLSTFWTLQDGVGACPTPANGTLIAVGTNDATVTWTSVAGATRYNVRYRIVGSINWISRNSTASTLTLAGLDANRIYEWQIRSQCSGTFSPFSGSRIFSTSGSRLSGTATSGVLEAGVYPNPTNGQFTLTFSTDVTQSTQIRVTDLTGRPVIEKNVNSVVGRNELSFNLNDYSAGLYFVNVKTSSESRTFKLIVQ